MTATACVSPLCREMYRIPSDVLEKQTQTQVVLAVSVSAVAVVVARVARVAMWAALAGPVLVVVLVYKKDSSRVLLHSYCTTITGWGVLLGHSLIS